MEFKVPFNLSLEERSLIELYSIINSQLKGPDKDWSLEKQEVITHKSTRVIGKMFIKDGEKVINSDMFTSVSEDARPKNIQVAIANIKLLVMCCSSLGIDIDFSYTKINRGADVAVDSWKEMAQNCGLDAVEVSKQRSIKSLIRYAKQCNFPIHQALDEAKAAFSSERVTSKQFFEFVFGESNYKNIKSVSRKRKAVRTNPVIEPVVVAPITPSVIIEEDVVDPRKPEDVKYVIGKLISQGVNTLNFAKLYPELSDKYGNFQYFCIHASDEEVSRIIIDKE
jgi:hypothetical protein